MTPHHTPSPAPTPTPTLTPTLSLSLTHTNTLIQQFYSKLASLGSDVVFSLNTILEYFDDRNTDSIKVRPPPITSTPLNKLRPDEFPMPENPDLDSGKKKIVLAGLAKAKGLFDEYFEALPDRELVADARRR